MTGASLGLLGMKVISIIIMQNENLELQIFGHLVALKQAVNTTLTYYPFKHFKEQTCQQTAAFLLANIIHLESSSRTAG